MKTPNNDIHGHEVMRMMLESEEVFDAASLEAAIHARFGESARFCTCSASGITAKQLIEFLGRDFPERGAAIHQSGVVQHEIRRAERGEHSRHQRR